MITLITAFIVDSLIGDPQTRFHPIAVLGRCIAVLDKLFSVSYTHLTLPTILRV